MRFLDGFVAGVIFTGICVYGGIVFSGHFHSFGDRLWCVW